MPPRKRALTSVPSEVDGPPLAGRKSKGGTLRDDVQTKRGQLHLPGSKQGVEEEQTWHEMREVDGEKEYTGKTEIRTRLVPPPERRCRANIGNGVWAGNRCARWTIKGGNVCASHGGQLPTVKAAAKARLTGAADLAAQKLIFIGLQKRNVADKDRIRALVEILDRAGVEGKSTVEIEILPWQKILKSIAGKPARSDDTIEAIEGEDYWVPDETEDPWEDSD